MACWHGGSLLQRKIAGGESWRSSYFSNGMWHQLANTLIMQLMYNVEEGKAKSTSAINLNGGGWLQ